MTSTTSSADGTTRCWWCGTDPLYVAYHDEEWGVPELDDRALYEKLVLDGFQAGLAWITILRKREAFRKAFRGFDPERVSRFGERDVARLLADAGIVRSRLKIEGAIRNARLWREIMESGPGSFRDYLWKHVGHRPMQPRLRTRKDIVATTPVSEAMAKDLKRRGFTFCGPTICYAFMQAVGMTNDHLVDCPRHRKIETLGRAMSAGGGTMKRARETEGRT